MGGPQAADVIVLPPGSVGVEGQQGTQYTGRIKSFNAMKGWGFVTGESLLDVFGKDIFIHKRELDGYTPEEGDELNFTVELDSVGQPTAKRATRSAYEPLRGAP